MLKEDAKDRMCPHFEQLCITDACIHWEAQELPRTFNCGNCGIRAAQRTALWRAFLQKDEKSHGHTNYQHYTYIKRMEQPKGTPRCPGCGEMMDFLHQEEEGTCRLEPNIIVETNQ